MDCRHVIVIYIIRSGWRSFHSMYLFKPRERYVYNMSRDRLNLVVNVEDPVTLYGSMNSQSFLRRMSYPSASKDNIFRYIIAFCLVQIGRFGDCIKFDANTMTSLLCVLLLFLMLNHITKGRQRHEVHNKKKLFKIIPQDDELHFQRQYCPP